MKTLIVISFPEPEFDFSVTKTVELSLIYIGHEIGYSGLGVLTIRRTMDSSIDTNGKSGLLTSFVEMQENIKKSFLSKGKKEVLKKFRKHGFKVQYECPYVTAL